MADDKSTDKMTTTETSPQTEKSSTEAPRRFEKVDGDWFLKSPFVKLSAEDHARSIRQMPMRGDDILIAAFPKCGTHWLWEVSMMLTKGKAEHDPRPKEQVMLEFRYVEDIDALPSPRVLNSHLHLRQLSNQIVEKQSRVVHVIRNPKDVAVSFYFHQQQMKKMKVPEFPVFARQFLDGGFLPGSSMDYFTYMREMMRWQRENPQANLINVYYEDFKKDPVRCVKQLADFLKVDASEELCADIADQCSFKKLKQADETFKNKEGNPEEQLFQDNASKMYRKGEVGDWKNYFTVAQSEEYDREVPEKLKGCDIKLQYTI